MSTWYYGFPTSLSCDFFQIGCAKNKQGPPILVFVLLPGTFVFVYPDEINIYPYPINWPILILESWIGGPCY